jgi:hypothetical protein
MAQSLPPSCPQCGTPLTPGQRFCSNCGALADPEIGKPTAMSGGDYNPQVPQMPTEMSAPPPPPGSLYTQPAQPTPAPGTYYPPQQGQNYAPQQGQIFPPPQGQNYQPQQGSGFPPPQGQTYPPQQGYPSTPAPVPAYAKPTKDSSKSVLGQMGCGVLIVILIIVGICGGASFFAYRYLTTAANSTSTSTTTTNTTTTGNSNGNGTPQAIPVTTTQMNATVTYASVDVTFVNAQKASSFTDDTGTSNATVVVRLNVKEHNPTTNYIFMSYGDNFHLILPDGTSVTAGSEQTNGGIGQAVTRNNWVDFPLTADVDISKLTLRIGAASEAQMDIPLTTNPDVSKYQLKTITPNTAFNYAGLNWTLTTVTSGLSADGKQATTGNRYIVLTLKADNHTQNLFFLSANDNARLQSGSTTSSPTSNTFNSIAAGTTGTTGTITFLMPQSATSFTLILLAQSGTNPPVTQVTTNFQI